MNVSFKQQSKQSGKWFNLLTKSAIPIVFSLVVLTESVASAQTTWTGGGTDTEFANAANWSSGAPSSSNPATVSSSATITIGSGTPETQSLVFNSGSSTLGIDSSATLTIDGTDTFDPSLYVVGGATLGLSGGQVNVTQGKLLVGDSTGNGTLNLSGGTLDFDRVTSGNYAYLTVGRTGGTGVVNQTAGTTKAGGSVIIGLDGGTGTYNLSGGTFTSGATWGGAHVYLGLNQGNADTTTGTFSVSGTGVFTMAANSYLDIGTGFTGAGATGGTGIFNQSGGTVNLNGGGFGVGDEAGGVGGTGSYNLSGGTLNVTSGYFMIGNGALSTGTFTQTAGTTASSVGIQLGGSNGNGTYNLNGGTLQVGGAGGISAGTGTSSFVFGGGTLQVTGSSLTSNVNTTLADDTSSTINTNGLDATFSGTISGATGRLIKQGAGNLNLTAASNSIGSFGIEGGNVNQATGEDLTTTELAVGTGSGHTASYTMTGGTITLPFGTPPPIVDAQAPSLRIGDFGGTGTFDQSGGTVTVNGSLNIGNQGGTGTYNLSGGTLNLDSGISTLGRTSDASAASTGYLNISGTGAFNVNGTTLFSGSNWYPQSTTNAGNGTITQTGGTFTVANTATYYLTGSGIGLGIYNLNGGTLAIGGNSLQGNFSGNTNNYQFNLGGGTIKVTGSSLTTDVNANLTANTLSVIDTNGFDATLSGSIAGANGGLQKKGTGNLNLTNASNNIGSFQIQGGNVNQATGQGLTTTELAVGTGAGNNASYTMTGGTITLPFGTPPPIVGGTAASFRIGDFGGTGTFDQSGGTVTVNGSFNLGNQGGTGTYNLSGGSLNLDSGISTIGRTTGSNVAGAGFLNISDAGSFNLNGTTEYIGSDWIASPGFAEGNGTVTQTGGTFTVANTATYYITGSGVGIYNLDGGTLAIGGNSFKGIYNNGKNGTYQFNLGGGTIKVSGSDLTTSVATTLTAGTTSTIDTNGLNARFDGAISGSTGALQKTGTGAVTFTAANTYGGGTTISAGTFYANNTSGSATGTGSVTVAANAILSGTGTLAPTGTNGIVVASGGTIAPGGMQTGPTPNGNLTINTAALTSGSTVLSLDHAGLTFSLGSGASSKIVVTGGVANHMLFSEVSGQNVVTINDVAGDLLGSGPFILIQGNATTYDGLVLDTPVTPNGRRIISGLELSDEFTAIFGGSELFLDGDNIVVDVVPEPTTWAMLLGGFTLLAVVYRRRQRA